MRRQIHNLFSYPCRKHLGVLNLIVLLLAIATTAQAQFKFPPLRTYTLVDLGVNDWAIGHAINNAGQAAGYMGARAFRTQGNQPINPSTDDLGVLPNHHRSFAHAIDNNGVVVGDSINDIAYQWRAFRFGFNGGGMESLHSIGIHSSARGINDHNWVVGIFTNSSQINQAMISWGPGSTFSLEFALGNPRQSEAYDVNNNDQIVGWLSTPTTMPRAFLYDDRAGVVNRLIHLGIFPGGTSSKAYGINDSGHVVGEADYGGWYHAFLWKDDNNNGASDPGEMRALESGYPCSRAAGINSSGTAVGYVCSNVQSTYGQSRAVMFSGNGSVVDLNTLVPGTGWTLREAKGINDNGQIVGWMQDVNGRVHAFRLDPPPPRIIWP